MPNDPRELGPKPPFPEQQQNRPGTVRQLDPPADHGESSYAGTGKLTGRVAIITGADSGIGRAVAIAFAREGADVVLSFLEDEQADAHEVAALIEEAGQKAICLPGDIRSVKYADSLVEAAFTACGRLDIVVNNAAYQMTREKIEEITPDEFERTLSTNVFGLFYLTRAALPKLKPGSVIINTTSIQAYEPSENLIPYAATKASIASLTKSIAKLAGQNGIRVNAVAPDVGFLLGQRRG
jgi:NAD(P)-dependent dehydrogenase (short-subunit alcohol dehydrogenase family)